MRNRRVAIGLAGAAGVIVAVQSRINGAFAGETESAIAAAALSAIGGAVVLAVAVALHPRWRRHLSDLPAVLRRGRVPRWTLTSGALGALLLASQAGAVPLLGVALYSVLLVSAQTVGGLGVDAAGLGPAGRQPITATRIVGTALAIVAVGLAALPDISAGRFVAGAALLSVVAGAGAAFQSAMLGRLGSATTPVTAVAVNFAGAAGVLAVVLLGITLAGADWVLPPLGPIWVGGPLGLAVVGLITLAVPVAGVLLVSLAIVTGQLLGSLLLDVAVPVAGRTPTPLAFLGAALLLAAVAIAGRRSPSAPAWKDAAS